MTTFDRQLSGDTLLIDVASEIERMWATLNGEAGRAARTLIKDGPLRVTLVVMQPGAAIPEHSADGPITVQPVSGSIRFAVGDTVHAVGTGGLLSVGAGVRHSVACDEPAAFLLTVAMPAPAT